MKNPITISPKTKTIYHSNPISGAFWSTHKILKGFEVSGGHWPWGAPFLTSSHENLKSAQQEVKLRKDIEKKGVKINND